MRQAERALEGLDEIRAQIETFWRDLRRLRVNVTIKQVRRYIRVGALPIERLGKGPVFASPRKVKRWFRTHLAATATAQEGKKGTKGTKGN